MLLQALEVCKSELSAFNKTISHNAFAITVLVLTFRIMTKTILTRTSNFHINCDGNRDIRSVKIAFVCCIMLLRQHLQNSKERNEYTTHIFKSKESEPAEL